MLQYLINATAIWLISLVMFDLLLRRESYHGYNRFYLLATFLLGTLAPLWQWQQDGPVYSATLQKPLEQMTSLKQTIVNSAATSSKINWESYLWYVYLLGVAVTLVLLLVEIVKLVRLYQNGKRIREGSCVIIETGRNHSPFSLFNMVFVNTRAQYTAEEWNLLMAHEQMHGLLFHFVDVLLLQLARILFWFHPLVYIYQRKLTMLHEYQADKVSLAKPQFYGQFLVEQALLHSAPSIAHSFNRSPIKDRIFMLTRNSSSASRSKMFLFIPLAFVCILFFSKNSFSQKFDRNGNIVAYRGNKFEFSKVRYDTITMIDPVTGKENTVVTSLLPVPIKMNGKKIFNTDEVTERPSGLASTGSFEDFIFKNLSTDMDKLPDGLYTLDIGNIVLNAKGKVIYYEYAGLSTKDSTTKIPVTIKDAIDKKIDPLINRAPALMPAKVKDTPVIVRTDILLAMYKIEVKNHKTSIAKGF